MVESWIDSREGFGRAAEVLSIAAVAQARKMIVPCWQG